VKNVFLVAGDEKGAWESSLFCFSPTEIEIIRAVLHEIGLPDLEFDGYEKQYNWCD
jgi:hypothetical protein